MSTSLAPFDRICTIISDEFNCPQADLTLSTTAEDVDGWDSLAHARLIMTIEDRLAIRFPGDKLFDLDCVGDLVGLAEEALSLLEKSTHGNS